MANTLTFANLTLTDANIFGGINYTVDLNAGDEFSIGNTASACVTFTTDTQVPKYSKDSTNGVFVWDIDGTDKGRFYITEVTKNNGMYTVTAYDAMYLTEKNISALSLTLPITVSACASAIATYIGCTISGTIKNGTLTAASLDEDMTIRELLGRVAEASGCSVKIDGSDHLCFMYYADSGITVTASEYIELEVADYTCAAIDNVTIYNMEGEVQASAGSGTNSLFIGQNPFLENATSTNATNIYNAVKDFAYAPLTCSMFEENGLEVGTIATFGTTPTLVMHLESGEGGAVVSSVGSDTRAEYNKDIMTTINETREIAVSAQSQASAAATAAAAATTAAGQAQSAASAAQSQASAAASAASAASTQAQQATQSAQTASQQAQNASAQALVAQQQAQSATNSANGALKGLATVEDVVDILNWIATHGEYSKTTDTTIVEGKGYYTLTATAVASPTDADIGTYYELISGEYVKTTDTTVVSGKTYYTVSGIPVTNPVVADLGTYYELTITEAVANYINTHLALTDEGLYVTADGNAWKVLVANDGVYIIDPQGNTVAQYKSAITLGLTNRPHVDITTTSQAFTMQNGVRLFELNADPSLDPIQWSMEVEATGQTAYEVGWIPRGSLTVKVDGVVMTEGVDYTLNQATIVFTTAPPIGSTVYWSGFMFVDGVSYTLGVRGYATTYEKGLFSVAEGELCVADARASHAEGRKSMALGGSAHAEGLSTTASGDYSHSQNNVTTAQGKSQTAIGEFNIVDTTGATASDRGEYALIIGNGTGYTARSNALAVTWDGNVHIDLAGYATTDDIDKAIYDALVTLGWDSEVTE